MEKRKNGQRARQTCSRLLDFILERECVPSLKDSGHPDRRFSTEQEAKLLYAARPTRGHQFGGVPTTPRGRNLFLLVIFFG